MTNINIKSVVLQAIAGAKNPGPWVEYRGGSPRAFMLGLSPSTPPDGGMSPRFEAAIRLPAIWRRVSDLMVGEAALEALVGGDPDAVLTAIEEVHETFSLAREWIAAGHRWRLDGQMAVATTLVQMESGEAIREDCSPDERYHEVLEAVATSSEGYERWLVQSAAGRRLRDLVRWGVEAGIIPADAAVRRPAMRFWALYRAAKTLTQTIIKGSEEAARIERDAERATQRARNWGNRPHGEEYAASEPRLVELAGEVIEVPTAFATDSEGSPDLDKLHAAKARIEAHVAHAEELLEELKTKIKNVPQPIWGVFGHTSLPCYADFDGQAVTRWVYLTDDNALATVAALRAAARERAMISGAEVRFADQQMQQFAAELDARAEALLG